MLSEVIMFFLKTAMITKSQSNILEYYFKKLVETIVLLYFFAIISECVL